MFQVRLKDKIHKSWARSDCFRGQAKRSNTQSWARTETGTNGHEVNIPSHPLPPPPAAATSPSSSLPPPSSSFRLPDLSLSLGWSICHRLCLSIYPSVCLSVCVFIYLLHGIWLGCWEKGGQVLRCPSGVLLSVWWCSVPRCSPRDATLEVSVHQKTTLH